MTTPQKNQFLGELMRSHIKKRTPTTESVEKLLLNQSFDAYISAFKANNGIVTRPMVEDAFKVYTINRERYFAKELETAKNYVYYSNHESKFEEDLAEKLRKCIMTYYLHKKFALAKPGLHERYFLQRSLRDVWSMINKHWKILSKDDPHANGNPTEFQDDIEEVLYYRGILKFIPREGFCKVKKAKKSRCTKPSALLSSSKTKIRHVTMTSKDDFLIVWDLGASVCVTHYCADFIKFSHDSDLNRI